jgi:hypothetical protein
MGTSQWVRVMAIAVLLATACGCSQPNHTGQATASAVRTSEPQATPTPTPVSDRTLELVLLSGSTALVVRDITDILHPKTLGTFPVQSYGPAQFIGGTDVALAETDGLVRMHLDGSSRSLLAPSASAIASTTDGTTVAYVGVNNPSDHIEQLHVLTGGSNRVVGTAPAQYFGTGCESQSCADTWDVRLLYSPNGAYISFVQMLPVAAFRLWTSDGKVLKSVDGGSATMSVWSGDTLYWRDSKGVEMWRAGNEQLLLPGVSWISPHASPAGGQIVYEARDAGSGTAHIYLLDTALGKVRELASSRSYPAFLNSHLIWYEGERPCPASDPHCAVGPTTPTGKTYIYDLHDGTETESRITSVFDVWPHPA